MLLRWTLLYANAVKEFWLEDGFLKKSAVANPSSGTFLVIEGTFADYVCSRKAIPTKIVNVGGIPVRECAIVSAAQLIECFRSSSPYEVFRQSNLHLTTGIEDETHIRRLASNFYYPVEFGGIFSADVDRPDPSNVPPGFVVPEVPRPAEFMELLWHFLPITNGCDYLISPTSSTNILNPENNTLLTDDKSYRVDIPISSQAKIPDLSKQLFNASAINGHGYMEISASGAFLKRAMTDVLFNGRGRFDFVGKPILHDGLVRACRDCDFPSQLNGTIVDVSQFCQSPNAIAGADALFRNIRKIPEYLEFSNGRKRVQVNKQVERFEKKNPSASTAQIKQHREAVERTYFSKEGPRYLPSTWMLHLDRDTTISAADLIERWSQFEGTYICDPLAPEEYDWGRRCGCYLYTPPHSGVSEPSLFSFAHGENQRYLFKLIDDDDASYIDTTMNESFAATVQSFCQTAGVNALYDLQFNRFDINGTHVRLSFDNDYWYFEREKLTIRGDEVSEEHKKLARAWKLSYLLYESSSASHQDSAMSDYYYENEGHNPDIGSILKSFNEGDNLCIDAGTGSGKSATSVIEAVIPRAIARARAMIAGEPYGHLELPIVLVPSEANINTLSAYFDRFLPEALEEDVKKVFLDPTKRVRLLSKYVDLIPHKDQAEFVEKLGRTCVIFSTYAYLQRRSFLNYCYPLAQVIATTNAFVLADEIHQLLAASFFSLSLDANFYEAFDTADDDFADDDVDSADDSDGELESATGDAAAFGEGLSGNWRSDCSQAINLSMNREFDQRICNNCKKTENAAWFVAKKGDNDTGTAKSHPLLPRLVNAPTNPSKLDWNRFPNVIFKTGHTLSAPFIDLTLVESIVKDSFVVQIGGGLAQESVMPWRVDAILKRKFPNRKKGEGIGYREELMRYLASLAHLQIQTFHATAFNAVSGTRRISRDDLENGRYHPGGEKLLLQKVACNSRILKGLDTFPFAVLAKANSLIVMSATIHPHDKQELENLFPLMRFESCISTQRKLAKVYIVDTPESWALDEDFLSNLDQWAAQHQKDVVVSLAKKRKMFRFAKNVEQYKSLAVFINEFGPSVSNLKSTIHYLRLFYARHPSMTGNNFPVPFIFLEQAVYQPKTCAFLPSWHPLWQQRGELTGPFMSALEDILMMTYNNLNNQNAGRSLRVSGDEDPGYRIIFRTRIGMLEDVLGKSIYPPIHPIYEATLNDRCEAWERITCPLGQRNKTQVLGLMESFLANPTASPTFALCGRNKRKARLTPLEKKKSQIDELVAAGDSYNQVRGKLNLMPSTFKGREGLLAEILLHLDKAFE